MTHSVQLVIGEAGSLAPFLRDWPCARAVDLEGGWQAVPIDDALFEKIQKTAPDTTRPPELDASPPGLEAAIASATRSGGKLAYVETDYWGGTGGQSAMAYADGEVAVYPSRSIGAGGPINAALRAIGVVRGLDDEFDTIGLGYRRTMADYEREGPVRLRGAPTALATAAPSNEAPGAPAQSLSVWAVLALIAAFIAIGIAASMLR